MNKEFIPNNEKRAEIQKEILELSRKHKHVLVEVATGVGKSKAAIDIVDLDRHSGNIRNKNPWLLVCKETNHIKNWEEQFQKHSVDDRAWSSITPICYASLHKYQGERYNLILDEVHAASDLRSELINTIKADKIISLSATVSKEVKDRLHDIEPFYEYRITTSEAIEWGILPEPEIKIVSIELSPEQRTYYEELCRKVNMWSDKYNDTLEHWTKVKMLRAGLDRKRFLAEIKTERAKELVEQLRDKRFICFSGSISQSVELGAKNNIVNSKVDKEERQEIIDNFNKEEIDQLHAVNMLRESMNLNNIDAGIIVQLDDQERTAVQSIGRVLRSIAPEIYILVVKDTKDEQFMKNSLKNIDNKYIEYIK